MVGLCVITLALSSGRSCERARQRFVCELDPDDRVSAVAARSRRVKTSKLLELGFQRALGMVQRGEICDAKTVMRLEYGQLQGILA